MTENEDALLSRLQTSVDAVKQVCVQWFASTAEMSSGLDAWSSLFEEYYCACLVDIETTPLSVHSDIDLLTKSKTRRHLTRMLDELRIHQYVSFVCICLSVMRSMMFMCRKILRLCTTLDNMLMCRKILRLCVTLDNMLMCGKILRLCVTLDSMLMCGKILRLCVTLDSMLMCDKILRLCITLDSMLMCGKILQLCVTLDNMLKVVKHCSYM